MSTRRRMLSVTAGAALARTSIATAQPAAANRRFFTLADLEAATIDHNVGRLEVERFARSKPSALMIFIEVANQGPLRPWERLSNRGARRWSLTSPIVSPEMFGAVGDGRHDDYQALQDLAAYCSNLRGGHVRMTGGRTYFIDRIRIYGGTDQNTNTWIAWTDCVGLVIDGGGATVSCKGDFCRPLGPVANSYWNSIIPFVIEGGRDIILRDLHITQNVDRMTRPGPQVGEGFAHCITLRGAANVRIERVTAEKSSTDGLMVHEDGRVRPYRACRNVTLIDCSFVNNSRLGMAVVGCVGLRATNCDFSRNGKAGRYGNTAPSAGVDVEPDYAPPQIDSITTDIVFERCRFDENLGGPFIATNPSSTGRVVLLDCSAIADTSTLPIPRILVCVQQFEVDGFTGHNIGISPGGLFAEEAAVRMRGWVRRSTFVGDHPAFQPIVQDGYKVGPAFVFEDCLFRLISKTTSPIMASGGYQIIISGSATSMTRCRFFASSTLHSGRQSSDLLMSVSRVTVRGLTLETNLNLPGQTFLANLNTGTPQAARATGVVTKGRGMMATIAAPR